MGDARMRICGLCIWDDKDIMMVIPFWLAAKRAMPVITQDIEGSQCGAWRRKMSNEEAR
jgi:hypothetical protein